MLNIIKPGQDRRFSIEYMEMIELFAVNKKTSLNQVFHEKTNYLLMKTGTNKQSTSCYQATNWQDILGVENNSLSVPW